MYSIALQLALNVSVRDRLLLDRVIDENEIWYKMCAIIMLIHSIFKPIQITVFFMPALNSLTSETYS